MSKLLEDPKVSALVQKEIAKAVKAENKRVQEVVKAQLAAAKEIEDKSAKKAVLETLKNTASALKAA